MNPASPVGGRRFALGLVVSWAAQLLQIASGFIIPRMIDHGAGAVTLGIWDFGWSLISYFSLLEAGIGSSVNRYIALERGKGNLEAINRIASSAALVQRVVAMVILLLTVYFAWLMPYNLKGVGPALEQDARWLVFLLGSSVGLTMFGAVYTGVLTGCHRWATHYGVYAVTNILSVVGMLIVLSLGYGIVGLGIVQLAREVLGRLIRGYLAYRACPGLVVSTRLADRATMRSMLGFGGRMALGRISRIVLAQTTSILIVAFLGPAALAVFVRPRSLVRQAAVFPQKYSNMLVPTVASLFGTNQLAEVRSYIISSCRTGIYMAAPIVVFLLVDGPVLIELWMGSEYADPILISVITFAFAAELCNQPLDSLSMGLNLHGRPAVVMMISAIVAVLAAWGVLALGLGLRSVAVAIAIPWTFAHGVYLPMYVCRRLEIPVLEFLKGAWGGSILCMFPFALLLAAGRNFFSDQPLLALLTGSVAGGGFLAACYWIWILPSDLKSKLVSRLSHLRFRRPITAAVNPNQRPS